MAKAKLLVIQGVDQGARFEIDEKSVGIGRGILNEIRILDTEISRKHASIRYANAAFVISDRNSSNGTFVNGQAIQSHSLQSGDQIQIGRSAILFSEEFDEVASTNVAGKVDLFERDDGQYKHGTIAASNRGSSANILEQSVDARDPAVAQTSANLQALYRITEEAVSPSISLDQLLKRILDLTIKVVGADRGCVLVTDSQTDDLVPQTFSIRRDADASQKMPVSRSIVDYVLKQEQGVRTSDARSDRRFEQGQSILQAGIREAMCVPMQGRYALMGVVYVDTTTSPEEALIVGGPHKKFNDEKLRLLVAVGRQAALAIEDNRYQQAFVKAERLAAMGQTIATLSHHIKNILQGVRGGSYLIDMGLKDHNEELVGKGWKIVEKNQNKIYHLVLDMLTFSKERLPTWQQASLNETVSDVCELMESRARECRVTLATSFADDIPVTTFDPDGIHQAVLNIITNAIDAVEGMGSGHVDVRTAYDAQGDEVFVEVSDNGSGITEDQVSNIFNIFESTKGARGTGLGLAVSQKIVREHGGDITVESSPGNGCRFRLAWPQMDEEQRTLEIDSENQPDHTD